MASVKMQHVGTRCKVPGVALSCVKWELFFNVLFMLACSGSLYLCEYDRYGSVLSQEMWLMWYEMWNARWSNRSACLITDTLLCQKCIPCIVSSEMLHNQIVACILLALNIIKGLSRFLEEMSYFFRWTQWYFYGGFFL
jgi:hypothetical protein